MKIWVQVHGMAGRWRVRVTAQNRVWVCACRAVLRALRAETAARSASASCGAAVPEVVRVET